jgi:hypothetical protein
VADERNRIPQLPPADTRTGSMPNARAEVMHRARVSDEELQLADGGPMLTLW